MYTQNIKEYALQANNAKNKCANADVEPMVDFVLWPPHLVWKWLEKHC